MAGDSAARRRARRAAQARRRRRRQREGKLVAMVELDGTVLDMLVRLHWLAEVDAGDRPAIERAISAMLACAARH
jgi:hypothetical protein